MRASPGGPVLKVLPQNTRIKILGRVGGWLNVQEANFLGFVSSKYVSIDLVEKEEVATQNGVVNASRLNFREEPDGRVIDVLPRGTEVSVLKVEGNWLRVEARGQTGYVSGRYVTVSKRITLPPPEDRAILSDFRYEHRAAIAPDGTRFANRHKKGVFNYGETSIAQFIDVNRDRFPDVSDSLLRVMVAVSENEGKYEAINTWDNAFLSFGIFQWTTGTGSEAGELPALLQRLQDRYQDTFEAHFGQYGLSTTGVRAPRGVAPRGYFTLKEVLLANEEGKSSLRSLPWAYRFWLAGRDDNVREVQTLHAMERVDLFLHMENRRIRNCYVNDYVTSEYGLALMLDQHVNRPGHVPRILGNAVEALKDELPIDDPQGWDDEAEDLLLEKYLELRATTSMTDSNQRARNILGKVESNVISKNRHSFRH
jgi:uncharacterized protein YraI